MASTIHIDIVSAEAEIFSGPAEMVFAPATMGDVGILPRHTPLLTTLKPGEVRVRHPGGKEETFYVSGGMLEIQPHVVTVLSDTAVRAEDVDEAAVLEAKERAERARLPHRPFTLTSSALRPKSFLARRRWCLPRLPWVTSVSCRGIRRC